MKNYVKGILTGFIIVAVVFAVPAMAVNLDTVLNAVRINVNGVDEIQWNEDIKLSNGETAPASILYNGTTYLPMRKLGELSGQKIYWNGDSKTVSMTGAQEDIKVVAKKPDSYGNVWEYYTFNDGNGNNYLGVKDEARAYERVYQISGDIEMTDEAIYFIRIVGLSMTPCYESSVVKLSFNNNENTQDGEILTRAEYFRNGGISGGYAYYIENIPGITGHSELWVYNLHNGETAYHRWGTYKTYSISSVTDNENEIIFDCDGDYMGHEIGGGHITYNKLTNTME